jgi:hypothetical protein
MCPDLPWNFLSAWTWQVAQLEANREEIYIEEDDCFVVCRPRPGCELGCEFGRQLTGAGGTRRRPVEDLGDVPASAPEVFLQYLFLLLCVASASLRLSVRE